MSNFRMSMRFAALLVFFSATSCSERAELNPLELEPVSVELFKASRILKVVLLLEEPKAYFSLERAELSVHDAEGRWLLHGVLQLSASEDEGIPVDHFAVRIPPGDDRGTLQLISGGTQVTSGDLGLGKLLPECTVYHTGGTALVTWVMEFENLSELPRKLEINARSIPRGGQSTLWTEVAEGLVLDEVSPPAAAAAAAGKPVPTDVTEAPAEPFAAPDGSPKISETTSRPALFDAAPESIIPLYSRRFDQVLLKKQEGRYSEALRLVASVYSETVPGDSFYVTLERQRQSLLEALIASSIYSVEGINYSVDDLREIFIGYLSRPDQLSARVEPPTEVDFSHFLFLHVAFGQNASQPKDPLLKNAVPVVDVNGAVASLDPWALSAALFHARKAGILVSPEIIVQRSTLRPDLWDEDCSNQTGLYLASRSGTPVDPALSEQFRLESVSPSKAGHCLVEVFQVNRVTGEVKPMLEPSSDLSLVSDGRGSSQAIDAASFSGRLLELESGRYTLAFQQGRIQDRSRSFDCHRNRLVRVVIPTSAGE